MASAHRAGEDPDERLPYSRLRGRCRAPSSERSGIPDADVIRDEFDARPYLPEWTDEEWEAETLSLIEDLVRRRERWNGRKR